MNIKNKPKYIMMIALFGDVIILILSFYMSLLFRFDGVITSQIHYYILLFCAILIWVFLGLKYELYEIPEIIHIDKILTKNGVTLFLFTVIVSSLMFFLFEYNISRLFLIYLIAFFSFLLFVWRIAIVKLMKVYRKRGNYKRDIIIVGLNENTKKFIEIISEKNDNGYHLMGLFADTEIDHYSYKFHLGKLEDVYDYCKKNKIDGMLISLPYQKRYLIRKLLQYGENNMIRVSIIPEFSEYLFPLFVIDYLNNIPIMKVRDEPMQRLTNKMIKRGFDLVFSWMIIFFIFSWLFPIIFILIKLTSKGPVFFTQMRTGRDGKPFVCYKFRTMKVNGDSDHLQASKNDARITTFGKFLRRTSLDELPQFFNVIKRKMSVVGPRPHMLSQTEDYKEIVEKFMVRHYAKPGITGWAQVNGFRGETKEVKDMVNRAEADIWYIENWSIILDIKIIFLTIWKVFIKGDENAF